MHIYICIFSTYKKAAYWEFWCRKRFFHFTVELNWRFRLKSHNATGSFQFGAYLPKRVLIIQRFFPFLRLSNDISDVLCKWNRISSTNRASEWKKKEKINLHKYHRFIHFSPFRICWFYHALTKCLIDSIWKFICLCVYIFGSLFICCCWMAFEK